MPALIGYTGGYNVYGKRGGVIGAAATMGVVIGSDITMLVGGMVMGPLAAWIIKKVDKLFEGKVKPGFEMLIDNFSIGIVAALLMVAGYAVVEPIFSVILSTLAQGVYWALNKGLIPFTAIFVQPACVLFLNNAINHGIMAPLGIQQVVEHGKSILFLVEANGGPQLGVLLAYMFFGRGMAKKSAAPAALIHFDQLITHPRLNDIRIKHNREFNVALDCLRIIEKKVDISMPIDEAAFLTMLFIHYEDSEVLRAKQVRVMLIILLVEPLNGLLKNTSAFRFVTEVRKAVLKISAAQGFNLTANAHIGIAMHLSCLIDKKLTDGPVSAPIRQTRAGKQAFSRDPVLKIFSKELHTLETKFQIEFSDDEIVYLKSLFEQNSF